MSREVVRSASNPALQRVRAVLRGADRSHCLLEGARLVADALRAGMTLELVLVSEERAAEHAGAMAAARDARVVARGLLDRSSALGHSPGILALARTPASRDVRELDLERAGSEALVLGVAGIGDPGNLGALARSAEAAGAAAIVVVRGGARPFGEKALRGSMGSLLRMPVYEADDAAGAVAALAERGLRQVVASVGRGTPYLALDYAGPLALWLPGEVGRSDPALDELDAVRIPMAGAVESLNVTVAASLLLFAAGRAPRA